MTALDVLALVVAWCVSSAVMALVVGRWMAQRQRDEEQLIDPPSVDHYEMRPGGRLVPVPTVVIEGTPLAQQEFAAHVGNDLGRVERVRAAAAEERRRVLAEMRDEHDSLSARPSRVVAAEALIDRVIPDPTIPKGDR